MSIHISAKEGEIAKIVLIAGDPLRAKHIAENFVADAIQNFICIHLLQIDYKSIRIFDGELLVGDSPVGLDGDTCVILCWPYPHGTDRNGSLCLGNACCNPQE